MEGHASNLLTNGMTDKRDKNNIIIFIKSYYEKNGKTPTIKVISSKCGVNSRVFYELFKSQREAFRIAGVPYSDIARKKVERANVARKMSRNKSLIEVVSEKETIYVVDKNRLNSYYRSTNIDPFSEVKLELANLFNKLLQSYSKDESYIRTAYDEAKKVIDDFGIELMLLYDEYKLCLSLKNAPADFDKVYLSEEGFDFDDIDGSFQLLKEKKLKQILKKYTPCNEKIRLYFNKLLDLN